MNIYLSLYCKGSKRVTQGLRVRGSWRPNRNCNILTPTLMAVNVVSFSFSWCSTGGPGVHSAGCWLSLLHLISIFSGPQFNQGSRGPLQPGVAFPYHISSISVSNSTATGLDWVIYCALDLWNRMIDRHPAEITVMQFTGYSLPVHQSMSVPWEFFSSSHFISQFPPTWFPLITAIGMCHFLPVHHLEWHFGPGRRPKYNTRSQTQTAFFGFKHGWTITFLTMITVPLSTLHTHTCLHARVNVYMYTCVSACVCMSSCMCVYARVYAWVHLCMCVCTCVCICVYVCIFMM